MNKYLRFLFLLYSLFINAHADPYLEFPKFVHISKNDQEYQLHITGKVKRKKYFIHIYNVASYLEEAALQNQDILKEILDDKNAKQLTIQWTHNAGLQRVRNGYLESFKKTLSYEEFLNIRNEIIHFLSLMKKDIKKGDEHILRWLPGGYIEAYVNGKGVGTIQNKVFAKILWSLWFTDESNGSLY